MRRLLKILASLGLAVLFLGVGAVLFAGAVLALRLFGVDLGRETTTPGDVAIASWIGAACIASATLLLAVVRRRAPLSYGLTDRRWAWNLGAGGLAAVAGFAVLIPLMLAAGSLTLSPSGAAPAALLIYGALWALAMLGVSAFEEGLYRGALQVELTQSLGFPLTAGLLSALFAASHMANSGETPIGIINVALIGLLFAWSVRVTGSLCWALGYHAVWNWLQTFVAGAANSGMASQGSLMTAAPRGAPWLSGGTTGPEGSVFCLAAIAIGALGLLLTARRRENPERPLRVTGTEPT